MSIYIYIRKKKKRLFAGKSCRNPVALSNSLELAAGTNNMAARLSRPYTMNTMIIRFWRCRQDDVS